MTMKSLHELHQEYLQRYVTPAPAIEPQESALVVPERAFVMTAESGRTLITAPLREIAATNPGFTYLRGRMVGADHPNANGAFWTSEDLELGQVTVAGGPVNWLHDETKIIGSLMDGQFTREQASGNHIVSTMAIWKFLYPQASEIIESAAANGELFQSMECVSRAVACLDGPNGLKGCGAEFEYAAYSAGETCSHIKEHSSMRRLIDPIFLGTAIIVPPTRPADAHASVELLRQAAGAVEATDYDGISAQQAKDLALAVLQWANR